MPVKKKTTTATSTASKTAAKTTATKKIAEEKIVSTPGVTTSSARKLSTSQKRVIAKMQTAGLVMPFEESLIARPRTWLESDMLNANWLLGEGVPMGSLWELIGAESSSKALPLSTPILTPSGWKKMADINIGDEVCDPDGGVQTVLDVSNRGLRQVYKVSFSDGTAAYCDKEHLWTVRYQNNNTTTAYSVLSFEEIARRGLYRTRKPCLDSKGKLTKQRICKWRIPSIKQTTFTPRELPVDPYVVGALLCIGSYDPANRLFSICVSDKDSELVELLYKALCLQYGSIYEFHALGAAGNTLRSTCYVLRRRDSNDNTADDELVKLAELLDLASPSSERSIPNDYLWGSMEQRTALFFGLQDGGATPHTSARHSHFLTKSKRLAEDITYLVRSLGMFAKIQFYETCHDYDNIRADNVWRVSITTEQAPLFTLSRKLRRTSVLSQTRRIAERSIVDMERVEGAVEEMKCIRVSGESGTYIINDFIVTHNSSFAYSLGGNLQAKHGAIVVPYDTERLDNAMVRRSELMPELTILPTREARASIPNIMNDMMERLVILQEENENGSYDSADGPANMILIWDSIGATATQTLKQALANKRGTGNASVQMGITVEPMSATAALLTSALKILHPAIVEANALAIFINQMRVTMQQAGGWGGPSEHSGGGRALKHAANIRLKAVHENIYKQFNSSGEKNITDGDIVTGIMFSLTTIKNKVSAPFKKTGFINMFGQGIDVVGSNVLHAMFDLQDMEVLPPIKNGYVVREDGTKTRLTNLISFYKTHPVEYAELCERIKDAQRQMDARITPDALTMLQQQADEIDRSEDYAEYAETADEESEESI